MKSVKYIGYFADLKTHPNRDVVLAATNKMKYICEAINESEISVEIVSAAGSKQSENGGVFEITPNTKLKLFRSFGQGGKICRALSRWCLNLCFFCYLFANTKKGETVIAYHSLGYMKLLSLLKKIRKIHLVLEVEEIYSDVIGSPKTKEKELDFFKIADSYIFPTQLLDNSLNTEHKPSTIIHGTYRVEEKRENCKFESDILHEKKHLLYAGTFDPRKGGSAAAAAAEHLPSNYHIHILGFGSEHDKKLLQDEVEKLAKLDCATVTMDGLLSGEDYIRFVQSCDVGFSTQNPNADFNNTSFPSKVLSYLANGLRVVSVKIPALECSAVDDLLFYYEGNNPEDIAKAVLSIDWEKSYDSREAIKELDKKFVKEIGELLNDR